MVGISGFASTDLQHRRALLGSMLKQLACMNDRELDRSSLIQSTQGLSKRSQIGSIRRFCPDPSQQMTQSIVSTKILKINRNFTPTDHYDDNFDNESKHF
jgi:hypothetical protein